MELVPDTLVLKIVEYDDVSLKVDTTLYILYDKSIHRFVIRGKRNETRQFQSCTYSFECKHEEDLADFIRFVIDKKNNVSYILYNYDNLPGDSNNITFDFLRNYDDRTYEISGYDNQTVKHTRKLLTHLRMLKNIFNYNN